LFFLDEKELLTSFLLPKGEELAPDKKGYPRKQGRKRKHRLICTRKGLGKGCRREAVKKKIVRTQGHADGSNYQGGPNYLPPLRKEGEFKPGTIR